MAKRLKRKSIEDINAQLQRIGQIKGGSTEHLFRASRIANKYRWNIQDAIGQEKMTPNGNRYMSADASTKVSSRVYRGLSNG